VTDGLGQKWAKAGREFGSLGADGARPDDAPEPVAEVTCPGCFRQTDRVHAFDVPVVIFGVVFVGRSNETVAGCPRCVRRRLWRRLLVSIPAANLLFPVVAPFILWSLMLSHSDEGPVIPPEYRDWANLSPPPPEPSPPAGRREKRLLAAFAVVLVVAVLLFLVLPRVVR
jgi:hypothetical protein